MWLGTMALLALAVLGLASGSTSPGWTALLVGAGVVSAWLVVVGAGLYRGKGWAVGALKTLIFLLAASAIPIAGFLPWLAFYLSTPLLIAALVVCAPLLYLTRPPVRDRLSPVPTVTVPPSARSWGRRLRPWGGFGLFVGGFLLAAALLVSWWVAVDRNDAWTVLLAPVLLPIWSLPPIVLGLIVWRGRGGVLADAIALGLAFWWTIETATNADFALASLYPLAVTVALAVGLFAPAKAKRRDGPALGPT